MSIEIGIDVSPPWAGSMADPMACRNRVNAHLGTGADSSMASKCHSGWEPSFLFHPRPEALQSRHVIPQALSTPAGPLSLYEVSAHTYSIVRVIMLVQRGENTYPQQAGSTAANRADIRNSYKNTVQVPT